MAYKNWSTERKAGFQLLLLFAGMGLVVLAVLSGIVTILLDVIGVI